MFFYRKNYGSHLFINPQSCAVITELSLSAPPPSSLPSVLHPSHRCHQAQPIVGVATAGSAQRGHPRIRGQVLRKGESPPHPHPAGEPMCVCVSVCETVLFPASTGSEGASLSCNENLLSWRRRRGPQPSDCVRVPRARPHGGRVRRLQRPL